MGFIKDTLSAATFGMFDGPEKPDLGSKRPDFEVEKLINSQKVRSLESQPETFQRSMEGVDQTASNNASLDALERNQGALGGDQSIFRDALKARAQKSYGMDMNKIERQARLEAPVKNYEQKDRATKNAQKIYQYEQDFLNRERMQAAQDSAARGAMIGQVLGLAGMAGGMMVGGPAGGAAGSQIGNAAGTGLANSK